MPCDLIEFIYRSSVKRKKEKYVYKYEHLKGYEQD